MSDYQIRIADNYNFSIGNIKKVVSDFFNKKRYLLHQKKLQRYLRLGLKIKNVYHVNLISQNG